MTLEFALAGSGSRGNAALVRSGATLLMVDCGFPLAEIERRLASLGVEPEEISAILVTHEHADHASGVGRLAERYRLPVHASAGTLRAGVRSGLPPDTEIIESHASFAVGDIGVTPLTVPHDAAEPTQFLFDAGSRRLAIVTDVGHVTPFLVAALGGLDALILESNHDETMLAAGPYPARLKSRVGGLYGHLSNTQAAGLLAQIDTGRLHSLALAHLSEQNNRPELARASVAGALGCEEDWIRVADQGRGLGWCAL